MSGHYCKTCDVDHGCDEHADCIRAEKEVEVLTAQLAASEAAALVVDAQAEALLERATAAEAARERAVAEVYAQETRIIEEGERRATAESALAEARRERDRLAAEWVAQADVYDAESAPTASNDDERRTALVKFVTAIALRDCARKLRALTPGADAQRNDDERS